MRRSIPLARRVRALRGPLILGSAWLGAVLLCIVLAFLQHPTPSGLAVAVIADHPVRAPESGRVAVISTSVGQAVSAGTVLMTLEVPGLSSELAGANAEIEAETAAIAVEGADLGRKFARDLDDAHTAVSAAQVALQREQAELASANADLARATAPGLALSEQSIADIRGRQASLAASVQARQVEVGQLTAAYAAARLRNSARNGEGSSARLDVLRARRDALQARMDALTLRATSDGVVTGALPVPGEWVTAGFPAAMLTESAAHEAVIYVDASRAAGIQTGAKVHVRPSTGVAEPAVVLSVGPGVVQLPPRHARDPVIAEWGVPVRVSVGQATLIPGEAVAVEF